MQDHDPLDLRAQDATREDKARRDKLTQQTEEADLKWLMGSKRGRRIIWRQLERTGVFRLSFNTNAMTMAFAEGNRNEGLRILGLIHAHCPESYLLMVREQTNESARSSNIDGSGPNNQ